MKKDSAQSKEEFVHGIFESIAKDYDRMNTLLSFGRHKAWRRFAMKKIGVAQGATSLDVCCGTCDWTLSLAEASQTGRVVGLDFSSQMLAVGKQKIELSQREQQIELVQGNAMKLPFPDHTFDYATIGFALRNVPDLVLTLQEMKRVVKPGGKVVSLELSKPVQPVFRKMYYFYFQKVLPWLGKWLANRYEQYQWLPESLVSFPDYQALAKIMSEEVGLSAVEVYPLTGGITALHIGYKPTN